MVGGEELRASSQVGDVRRPVNGVNKVRMSGYKVWGAYLVRVPALLTLGRPGRLARFESQPVWVRRSHQTLRHQLISCSPSSPVWVLLVPQVVQSVGLGFLDL